MPGESMRTDLITLLDDFRRYGDDLAVVRVEGVRRRETSYRELARLAGRFAALLELRGIGLGDRVLLWAENSAEWMAAFYGTMLRGALAVPLDAYGSAEFALRVAADVRPKLVVGDAAFLSLLKPAPSQVSKSGSETPSMIREGDESRAPWPTMAFEEWSALLPAHEAGPAAGLSRDTPLQILFTSGTTGEPKGIVHTHGNVLASVDPIERGAQPYMRYERIFHPLRILHTLPLSHVFGQTMGLWVPALFAAEVHFENRLVAPRLVEAIRRERISVLAAVPRVMALLKTHLETAIPGLAERVANSKGMKSLRRWWVFRDLHRALGLKFWALVSGGGTLPGPLEQFWNAVGLVVVQGYGMTETTALITLNHPFHVARGTIGRPLPGRELKLGPDGEVLVRGPMISDALWSGGRLQRTKSEWLSTGDLAEETGTGELRFLGRKSEVIVTAAGVNIHPEDLEEALEQERCVKGCAVVPLETAHGMEPYAVLAVRGGEAQAQEAVENANARLAEFQRVGRWTVWPEPDLPRTSTGKVRRKVVASWVAKHAQSNGHMNGAVPGAREQSDWLYTMVAGIAGEHPVGDDGLRLSEDFHLDSLGRVQLAAALEERLGELPRTPALEELKTLGELRRWAGAERGNEKGAATDQEAGLAGTVQKETELAVSRTEAQVSDLVAAEAEKSTYLYPHWPWWAPVALVRAAFLELIVQPLIWLLAKPRVVRRHVLDTKEPMLIVGNHVTAYDGPLIEYALPGAIRRRTAIAMSGEMLEDFRHFRDPERKRFMLLGPIAYFLVTALYNVFPLPRRRDFQRSFAHAGAALDCGLHVMVFPEGTRSATGELARFRPGIGMLVKQAHARVLPVAVRGLGALKEQGRGWFRSGTIEVCVGEPLRFRTDQSEAEITARLQTEVKRLLREG